MITFLLIFTIMLVAVCLISGLSIPIAICIVEWPTIMIILIIACIHKHKKNKTK